MQASLPSQTQSRVHSSGCIKDGCVICACDKPAERKKSQTKSNPGRIFYRCAANNCSFWNWEDGILGSGGVSATQQKEHQQDGKKGAAVEPMTPTKASSSSFPISPPSARSTVKRKFLEMGFGLQRRPSELVSAEEKARRMANIEAGLRGGLKEEEIDIPLRLSNFTTQSISVGSDVEDEDESAMPANKRVRFASSEKGTMQHQAQPELPSTPTRKSDRPIQLLTPSSSLDKQHGAAVMVNLDDAFDPDDAVPPSPTSFTKAGRRAKERQQEWGSFALQLASTIQGADYSDMLARAPQQNSGPKPQIGPSSEPDVLDALTTVQTGLPALIAEKQQWRRRAIDAEKQLAKLQEENKMLRAKLLKEKEFADGLLERLTQRSLQGEKDLT